MGFIFPYTGEDQAILSSLVPNQGTQRNGPTPTVGSLDSVLWICAVETPSALSFEGDR